MGTKKIKLENSKPLPYLDEVFPKPLDFTYKNNRIEL